jgi:hypothetical protein
VFTSSVNHVVGVATSPGGTFDFDNSGNGFSLPAAVHPDPACLNCSAVDSGTGQLFLWRRLQKRLQPGNAITQLTFQEGGSFGANQFPDISQDGRTIAWDSNRNHTGGNADLSREIFVMDVATGVISQVTSGGGGDAANRNVNLTDDGKRLVFDSNRNFAGVLGCTLPDRVTACNNADGNQEIMLYDRRTNRITQLTSTSGQGVQANQRARISGEGRFVAFQSTVGFAGTLPGGTTCTQRDGISACGNDNNGEIMLFDVGRNALTQITNTVNMPGQPCGDATPNERVELSSGARYLTWQSACEDQLNPTACGTCSDNDEVFLFERRTAGILQLTTSETGFNRVPRVTGTGTRIVFESDRNYEGLNPGQLRTLYVLRTDTRPGDPGFTGRGQLVADPLSPLTQNPDVNLVGISFAGGFNTALEQVGASSSGRYFVFDNRQGVGNQEIWFLDRAR